MNCVYVLNFVRTSQYYTYFLLMQLFLSLILFIYVMIDPIANLQKEMVMVFELILTFLIFVDILIRIYLLRKAYFDSLWNIFDLLFFIIIILLFSVYYGLELHKKIHDNLLEDEDIFGLVILISRYLVQLARMAIILKQSHSLHQINQNNIPFDLNEQSHDQESFSDFVKDHNSSTSSKNNTKYEQLE